MAPDEQRARRTDRLLRLAGDGTAADGQAAAQLGEAAVTLLEGSPEGIAIVDGSGLIVYWNGAAEQQFGLERSRALGQELASLIFPDHLQASVRAVLLREIDEPGEGLGQRRIELGARRADGREIPVDIATKPVELDGSRWLAVYLDDASERSERERELHADARRRSAVLDLGQSALEGMDMDQLLQRAVALTIDELGVDRCEVWRRDDDGSSMTLRASSGWPDEAAGTRVPLVTSTQPGYTLLRGQGAIVVEDFRREGRFGAVGPDGAASPQSSISIRIPGTSGGFGSLIAASETLRRFELSDISLFVSLAQTLGAAIERARAIDSLADAERQIRTLIERLPSITYRAGLGARGEWYFISPQVEEIIGYTVEEWMADPGLWERAVHPDDIDWVLEAEDQSGVDGKPLDVAYRIRKRDGEMIWVRDRASVGTVDENGVLIVEGLITDISEQRAAEDRLRYLAEHDELTGLMNRRCFEVAVDREIGSNRLPGERGAMVIIDLDHLKRVNDTLGRSTGDRVVADIAKMLADDIGAGQLLSTARQRRVRRADPGRRRGPGARARRQPAGDGPGPDRDCQPDRERRRRPRRTRHGRQRDRPDHGRRHRPAPGQGSRTRPGRDLHRRGPQQARVGRPRPPGHRGGRPRPLLAADHRHGLGPRLRGGAAGQDGRSRQRPTDLRRRVRADRGALRARPQPRPLGRDRGARPDHRRQARQRQHLGRDDQRPKPDREGRRLTGRDRRRPVAADLRDHRDRRHSGDRVAARLHRPRRGARLWPLARRRRDRLRLAHLPPPPAVHRAQDRHAVRPRRHRVGGGPQDRRVARRHRQRARHAHRGRGRRQPGAGRAAAGDRRRPACRVTCSVAPPQSWRPRPDEPGRGEAKDAGGEATSGREPTRTPASPLPGRQVSICIGGLL